MQRSIPKLRTTTTSLAFRLLCLLFLLSGVANATVHIRYVSPTGNDATGNGSLGSPWRSIQHAVLNPPAIMSVGDTLLVDIASGFYNESVRVPVGWPSEQLACAICPGAVKLILKGHYVDYISGGFVATSPVTGTRNGAAALRNPVLESIVQQVPGRAAIDIEEGTDVEVYGLLLRTTTGQAITFDADRDPVYGCNVQFPFFQPQGSPNPNFRIPSVIKIKHNIVEAGGISASNSEGEGFISIQHNTGTNAGCANKTASTVVHDNVIRNVFGVNIATTPDFSIGLYLQNVTNEVKVTYNYFQGNNSFLPAGNNQNTMSEGIVLFGVRGTKAMPAWIYKNRVQSTRFSGIVVESDEDVILGEGFTSRWINVKMNSIENCNSANVASAGGVEVTMNLDNSANASLRNQNVMVDNNVLMGNWNAGVVYNGTAAFDTDRRFTANHNIFISNRNPNTQDASFPLRNGVGAGILHNNNDPFAITPLTSPVDAGGNWWGSKDGPNHLDQSDAPLGGAPPFGAPYNFAPGNQEVRFPGNQTNILSVYYSPWLKGYGTDGKTSPDDIMDDNVFPYDTASWGFNNSAPKIYIVKELQGPQGQSEMGTRPEFHVTPPDMFPVPRISGPSAEGFVPPVEGYINKAVSLSKDMDTLQLLAGTFQEVVQVSKALYIRGPMAGISASCSSTRDLNTPAGIKAEAKIVKGRFLGNPTQNSNQPSPMFDLFNKKITLDGLCIYAFQSQAIDNSRGATNQPFEFKNLIIRTMDVAGAGNSANGPTAFSGGAFVNIADHTAELRIHNSKFEKIIGRYPFSDRFASSACVNVENCDKSSWIMNNYFEGDPTLFQFDVTPGNTVIRLPMSYGVIVNSCNPTGTDSLWVTGNYIFRPDDSGIILIDSTIHPTNTMGCSNIIIRRNTIEEANVGTYDAFVPPIRAIDGEKGGIELYFGNTNTRTIWVTYNHFKNCRNAGVILRQYNGVGVPAFNVPQGLKINYNLFNNQKVNNLFNQVTLALDNGSLYTYANTANDAGIICGWMGTGNVNGLGNWWGTEYGPTHINNFPAMGGATGVPVVYPGVDREKVHYSPWLSGATLPDDLQDRGPVWNPLAGAANYNGFFLSLTGVQTNLNMDCTTWGYQDRTQKSYYVRISSPGIAACQPQTAHNMMKEGDIVNIRDVTAFDQEDLVVTKTMILDADERFNQSTHLRDITVLNGKRVSLEQDYSARNINLACFANLTSGCYAPGAVFANGYIETYVNPAPQFIKELTFTGTVCELPDDNSFDKYVRGKLTTRRKVGSNQSNAFGNMGFFLYPGADNLDTVRITRYAGPDTLQTNLNPDFSRMVVNSNQSINRVWHVWTKNAYTSHDRNIDMYWYRKEDNNNSVLLSRPWYKNITTPGLPNSGVWTGMQPASVSQDFNPRRVTALAVESLTDTITIAENECNLMVDLSMPSSSVICAGESVNFDVTITGGFGPFVMTYTENGVVQPEVPVSGAGPVYTIMITPNPNGPLNRVYKITGVRDVTGCNELANLGVQRDLTVKPTPTVTISGNPTPVCNNQTANYRLDFTGIGPWHVTYRVASGPLMEVTTSNNPYTLMVTPPQNNSPVDQTVDVTIVSVDYGTGTCMGMVAGNATKTFTVRKAPTASYVIASNSRVQVCACEPAVLDVLLSGQGPWILEYTINGTPYTSPLIGSSFDPTNFPITRTFTVFPNIINPTVCPSGEHTVMLTKVTDANGCTNVPAGNVSVIVDWRPRPEASFSTMTYNVCEGTNPVNLQVNVVGRGPWTITYRQNGVDMQQTIGATMETTGMVLNMPVTPPMSGINIYTINGVKDGFGCSNNSINSTATVNVTPLPTAGWVNNDLNVCIGGVATMMIEVTGKGPWTFTHTQNGVAQQPIVLGNQFSPSPSQFPIPVNPTATTSYCITSIIDGNIPACVGNVIGTCRTVNVFPLPTASLLTNNVTVCEGQAVTMQVFLTGRGPWTLGYSANNQAQTPVIIGAVSDPTGGVIRSFSVTPSATTVYCLTTVSDGSSPNNSCTNTAVGVCSQVTVNKAPTAEFAVASPVSTCQGTPVSLPVVVTGKGPWFIRYQILPAVGPAVIKEVLRGTAASPSPSTFTIDEFLNTNAQICLQQITEGNNCIAVPSGNTCVSAFVDAAPSAVLSGGAQIACIGQPVNLTVSFTGSGPWTFTYREGSNPSQTVTGITQNPYTLVVTPVTMGSVTYSPISVSYTNGTCTSTLVSGSATIQVNALPTAAFTTANTTICEGNTHGLGIILSGRGPWTVTYMENGVQKDALIGTGVSPNPFPTVWSVMPTVTTTYTLMSVKDANNCSNTATGSVTVTVNPAPGAMFTSNAMTTCVGTSTCLPLSLKGKGPWTIIYLAGSTPVSVSVGATGQVGTAAAPVTTCINTAPVVNTTYTLIGVFDSGIPACPGTISGSPLVMTVAAQPTANLSNLPGAVPTVCAGTGVDFAVNFTGTPPFTVDYTDGVNTMTETFNTTNGNLHVTPTTIGTLTYRITRISYNGSCAVNAPSSMITGTASVNVTSAPTAVVNSVPAPICLGGSVSLNIGFTGQMPFRFTYTVNGVLSGVNNIMSNTYTLNITPTQMGNNAIVIVSANDNGNCPAIITNGTVNVMVNQGPTATLSGGGQGLCLGSSASFTVNFTGMAPWSITYVENPGGLTNTINNIMANPYTLNVVPNATGLRTFTLVSVSDASGCGSVAGAGSASVTVSNATNINVIAVKSDAQCNNGDDGRITVTAFITPSCDPGQCPLEYSIDGMTWQSSNVFTSVSAGTYIPRARLAGSTCAAQGNALTVNQPANISNLRTTNITVNSANVAWTPFGGQGTVFYEVQYRIMGQAAWTVAGNNIVTDNFNLTNLQNNTTYEVRVRMRCNGDNFSNFINGSFTTIASPGCATPGGIFIDNIGPGMATVHWTPVASAACYLLEFSPVGTNTNWTVVNVPAPATSFTLNNLTGSCNYRIRIRTNCTLCSSNSGVRSTYSARFQVFIPNAGCRTEGVVEEMETAAAVSSFKVYPNPNNGQFTVSFETAEANEASLKLVDVNGRVIFERTYTTQVGLNELPVELSGFAAGIYVLQMKQGESINTTKVVLN